MPKRISRARSADQLESRKLAPAIVRPGSVLSSVNWVAIDALVPDPKNARTHSRNQLHRLQQCISAHGFLVPVLVDESKRIVSGHGRLLAARALGLKDVPTLTITGLSPAQIRAFMIAENRLSDLGGWDNDLLRLEIVDLLDQQIDVELTAFSTGEIDILLDGDGAVASADDDVPDADPNKTVTRRGDCWRLRDHRVACADATDPASYEALLKGRTANVVFTDPPFNVRIEGHVSGLGKVKHREFAMASGEMSPEQFTCFLVTVLGLLARHSRKASIHYVCMDWRHLREVLEAGTEVYTDLKNVCVWNKSNAGMGSFYRSKHELILVFQNGEGRFQNNVSLGATGRYRSNVWDYPGMNSVGRTRKELLAMHPTVKPVALVADALRDSSKRGDLVLDPFAGSGTTLIAAHRTGRSCAAMELDPAYVDVIVRRWEKITGEAAVLDATGAAFTTVKEARQTSRSAQEAQQ